MARRIVIIQGNPDPSRHHYGHALESAYGEAARAAGHEVRDITVAKLPLPYIATGEQWKAESAIPEVRAAQQDIAWADHLVIIFPLWLGDMPAILKSFLEHISCGGFVMAEKEGKWSPGLKGKSARVIVTMGMPAVAYRWLYLAHSLKSLERNILRFAGVSPVKDSLIGMVGGEENRAHREDWLKRVAELGEAGE
ncbi:MAG: NAD(P)H-dependent oxidoreductase [Beijerinckiaceae bacterium]